MTYRVILCRILIYTGLFITFLCIHHQGNAQTTRTWNGLFSTDWDRAINWSPIGGVPGANDIVRIPVASRYPVIDHMEVTVAEITIEDGASLSVTSEEGLGLLWVDEIVVEEGGTLQNNGRIEVLGGANSYSLTNEGTVNNIESGNIFGTTGIINVQGNNGVENGGTFNNRHLLNIDVTTTGILNTNGGTFNNFQSGTAYDEEIVTTIAAGSGGSGFALDNYGTFDNRGALEVQQTGTSSVNNRSAGSIINYGLMDIVPLVGMSADGIQNYGDITNNGTIEIDHTIGDGLYSSGSTFSNNAGAELKIGQSDGDIGNSGIFIINNASFSNDGGTIQIDGVDRNDNTEFGIVVTGFNGPAEFENINGGEILIGQTSGNAGIMGIIVEFGGEFTNEDSRIEIGFAEVGGFYLIDGGILRNQGSAVLEIGANGRGIGGNGLWLINGCTVTNQDDAIIRIDDTDENGLEIDGENDVDNSFVNKNNAKIIIGENYGVGKNPPNNFSDQSIHYYSNSSFAFQNLDCAEIYLYEHVRWQNDGINNGFIYVESSNAHEENGSILNGGIISYEQDDFADFVTNTDVLVPAITLTNCPQTDVVNYGAGNNYTLGSTWYVDEALTIEIGQYDQATNSFSLTGAPTGVRTDMYYTITGNGCTIVGKTLLILEDFVAGSITWTGDVSTNWHSPCNWSQLTVPSATDQITIPNTTNAPVISSGAAAVGSRLIIESDATLTINSGNTLTISGSATCLQNNGTLHNYGQVIVNDGSSLINNPGTLVNYSSGEMELYDCTNNGLTLTSASSTLENYGNIDITDVGFQGVLVNDGATLVNHGDIDVGVSGSAGNIEDYGVWIEGDFDNESTGELVVKNSGGDGIVVFLSGDFDNRGSVEITQVDNDGLANAFGATIRNRSSAIINIGGTGSAGNIGRYGYYQVSGTFTNQDKADLICENTVDRSTWINAGTFTNNGILRAGTGGSLLGTNGTLSGNAGIIELLGDWTNEGTFTPGTSFLFLEGPNDQTISSTNVPEVFFDVEIDKTAGEVILNNAVEVTFALQFTNGNLDLNGQMLDLGTTATLQGESASSYGLDSQGGGYFQAERMLSSPSGINPGNLGTSITSSANLGSVIIQRYHQLSTINGETSINRYYDITAGNNTGLNATVDFYYLDHELDALNEADLNPYRFANGSWEEYGASARNGTDNYITCTGIDAFSGWTLAAFQLLPVEWSYFHVAKTSKDQALLTWTTTSETNNRGFEVEYSKDGQKTISSEYSQFPVDVTHWAAGAYLVQLIAEGQQFRQLLNVVHD